MRLKCHKRSTVGVLCVHRQLPARAGDVGNRDVERVSDGIQAGLEVWHGPTLADDVAVQRVAAINTETGTAVAFGDNSTRATLSTRLFLILQTYLSMTAEVRGLGRYGRR